MKVGPPDSAGGAARVFFVPAAPSYRRKGQSTARAQRRARKKQSHASEGPEACSRVDRHCRQQGSNGFFLRSRLCSAGLSPHAIK